MNCAIVPLATAESLSRFICEVVDVPFGMTRNCDAPFVTLFCKAKRFATVALDISPVMRWPVPEKVRLPVVIVAVPAFADVTLTVTAANAATPVMVPESSRMTVLFWISLPVVWSKRVMALSVADAGPTTSPVPPPPPAVVHDNVAEPLVVNTWPLEPSAEGSV